MSVTPRERNHYRPQWRLLCLQAIETVAKAKAVRELDVLARGAKAWIMPTGDRAEELTCIALVAAAKAYCAQAGAADRQAIASGLLCFAGAVGDLLDATDTAPPATAPRFRADIDG